MTPVDLTQVDKLVCQLPTIPHVVQRALDVMDKDDVSALQVAKSISHDPVLVAKFLQIANSPFFGLAGKITSIEDACIVLGMNTLRATLMAVGVMQIFPVNKTRIYNREAFWYHSLCVAGITRFIAARLRVDEGSAFTSGLLHDIGKLAFEECFGTTLPAVFEYQKEHDCHAYEAEQAIFGVNHALFGAKLAQLWKLPAGVITAIAEHHAMPAQEGRARLVDIVNLGNTLFYALQLRRQSDVTLAPLAPGCMARLRLSWGTIRNWLPEIDAIMAHADVAHYGS